MKIDYLENIRENGLAMYFYTSLLFLYVFLPTINLTDQWKHNCGFKTKDRYTIGVHVSAAKCLMENSDLIAIGQAT